MRLFFYGTLMAGAENSVARAAHRHLRPLGPADMRGRLYAIPDAQGWYPALVDGPGRVRGQLFATLPGFDVDLLAALDVYEGWNPGEASASLYRRVVVAARCGGAVRTAHAYRFNQPLPARARAIAPGDFAAFADRHRLTVYAEAR